MNKTQIISIILLAICVFLSSMFSGAEMAFAKVNKLQLKRETNKTSKITLKFAEDYASTVSTILLGNTLVNLLASSIAAILFVGIFKENGELYTTLIMTAIILTFGEILPKSIAASFSYPISKMLTYPIGFFKLIFAPLVWLNSKLVNGITKKISSKEDKLVTDDELITMVDTMEEQGLIDEDTQELITNAIEFVDVDANEIMVHRKDIFAFEINDDLKTLYDNKDLLNYSRIPVYKDNLDNIVGILNTKQFVKLILNKDEFKMEDILTEPLYVFKTQSISSILKEFKEKHLHIAIVKDEYGGNLGMLTLEDILEELVGDILDEKDKEEEEEYHKVSKDRFTVDGEMNLYDFFDLIDYDYEVNNFTSQYTTVSGWMTDMLKKFPEEDDSFEFEGYSITVMKATEFVVERARIIKLKQDETEEE